jgi:hypothetical protein
MPNYLLRRTKVPIPLWKLLQNLLILLRQRLPNQRKYFIFLIEKPHVLCFLLLSFPRCTRNLLAEADEATIAFHIASAVGEHKALGDCCFHLSDCGRSGGVQINECAILTMHDEVSVCTAGFGDLGESVDVNPPSSGCDKSSVTSSIFRERGGLLVHR